MTITVAVTVYVVVFVGVAIGYAVYDTKKRGVFRFRSLLGGALIACLWPGWLVVGVIFALMMGTMLVLEYLFD
jgi:hypothetical protein